MTLTDFFSLFVFPHVAAGTAALSLFWIAALMRKGTAIHRRIGQAYLVAMGIILITSLPLVGLTWLRGHTITAVFLAYLTILIALSCRNTLAAIRFRTSPERYFGLDLRVLVSAVSVSGVAVMLLGLSRQAWILVGFGLLGPVLLVVTIKRIRALRQVSGPATNWWLREHAGAMIANGTATHIAFFQIGLNRLFPNLDMGIVQNLAWFGPLIIALIAGIWLNRRFESPTTSIKPDRRGRSDAQPLRAS
ncbi:MAG: hypothetical protein V2J20_01195 [Wenzhouxiangella sp.]|jgi:uncharacterized membrane protein|nr:hypothetical protein [Wenzhouxiangella sp.]